MADPHVHKVVELSGGGRWGFCECGALTTMKKGVAVESEWHACKLCVMDADEKGWEDGAGTLSPEV